MSYRIWADPDRHHPGNWIGRFSTARGIRTVSEPQPSIEAAKIAAGEELCRMLDQLEPLVAPTPPRTAKKFAVMKHGRRARLTPTR